MLKSWSDRTIGNIRLQLEVDKEVLHRLEQARDLRPLASHEEALRHLAKLKTLGLASLQRSIARQESRLLWLQEGDASTKFFHAYGNSHWRRNQIRSLSVNGELLTLEQCKVEMVFLHFDEVLDTSPSRSNAINLDLLNLPSIDPAGMGDRFTEAEV
jgi:hypothetical protein